MTTTPFKLSHAQKDRLRLILIGAGLLGLPLLFGALGTNAAVAHGHSADAWWLWLIRIILAAVSALLAWKVITSETGHANHRDDKPA